MSLHVHCTAFYSPATEALINNNNNNTFLSLQCPPVAVAIAMEKHRGVSHASCSRLQFAVVELSDRVGWNSGLVKRELKQLQWGATDDGE